MNVIDMLTAWRFCTENNLPDQARKLRDCIDMMIDIVKTDLEGKGIAVKEEKSS